jgi:hypothetical protein
MSPHSTFAQGFKFSQEGTADEREQDARSKRIAERLSAPCRATIKDRKIMVVIGEQQSNGYVVAYQQDYGPHFQVINARLRALGLKTYTPEELRKQIAQAEIDAYFKNDPDAAIAASRRLGASFILRGLITTETTVNPLLRMNEVRVGMGFTLAAASGRIVSDAGARAESYAGRDARGMALTLLIEQADEVVSQLYADYCNSASAEAR